jgi:hypothetical protein
MPSVGGYAQTLLLDQIFGPAIACVRTAISANATAQTAINIGSVATGGVSGSADTTPASNAIILVCHPGSGATQNQYSVVQAFVVTSSTTTAITIPSQDIGNAISVGDFVFYLGLSSQTGPTFLNTLYVGLSTATWSSTVTDATLYGAEPTSAGSYARLPILNSSTNWPLATGPASGISTIKNGVAQSFTTSTAAFSTGGTALSSMFIADKPTLAGGNIIWSGALTPPTDTVTGSGVTFSFAINALTQSLQ